MEDSLNMTGWKLEDSLNHDRLEVRKDRLEIGRFLIDDRLEVRRDRLEIGRFLVHDRN